MTMPRPAPSRRHPFPATLLKTCSTLGLGFVLVLSLAACDSTSGTDTAASSGVTAGTSVRVMAPPDAGPPGDAARLALSSDAPPLYLQPRNQNYGWACFGAPCYYAVDFAVPEGAYWTISEIGIEAFFNANTSFDGFSFGLHADDRGAPAPGALFSRTNADYTSEGFAYSFDVSGAAAPVLAGGTYWLVFDVVNEDDEFKAAFNWLARVPPVGSPALFAGDPDGGDWGPAGSALGDQDFGFSLFGFSTGIDILPGSDENPVNLTSRGRLPVAVLSTDAFDSATLDPATITLGDNDGADTPVAARRNGTLFASLEDVDGDGLADLVLHFEVPALVGNGDLGAGSTRLILNGTTLGGDPLRAADSVRIVGPEV